MPFHNGWLPREGLTGDVVGRLIRRTALNPALTLAILGLARFTNKGVELSNEHKTATTWLQRLVYIGVFRWVTNYLNAGTLNNWTSDPTYDWNKEVILITGGAGGIGARVVQLFAERNIHVVILDVQPLQSNTPAANSPFVHHYTCDITSPSAIASVATRIRADVGAPTILINNAGVARGKTILEGTEKDVRFTFEVNTLAHYWLAKEFLPSMVAADHGMVVTVASLAAYLSVPDMVDYASSKASAMSFHEGLTAELKTRYNAKRVRTVLVTQAYTKTPLFEGFGTDNEFLMPALEPDTVAEGIVRQVLTGKSGHVMLPGFANVVTFLRALPHWYQLGVRAKGESLMKGWNGRQVIDVDKWSSEKNQKA